MELRPPRRGGGPALTRIPRPDPARPHSGLAPQSDSRVSPDSPRSPGGRALLWAGPSGRPVEPVWGHLTLEAGRAACTSDRGLEGVLRAAGQRGLLSCRTT